MKKRNIFIRYLVLLMMIATFAACSSSGDKTEQRAEALAEKVEKKAKQTQKAEGKNDLVKDEVKVKTDAKGEPVVEQVGEASWYGKDFHGKKPPAAKHLINITLPLLNRHCRSGPKQQ